MRAAARFSDIQSGGLDMVVVLHALSDRAAAFASRQPRIAIGGGMLCCIVVIELLAAIAVNGAP